MKQFNFDKGRLGEEIARKYLQEKEYELVEANHRNYLGEIDLIFSKSVNQLTSKSGLQEKAIIFVEVKLKIGDDFGTPEEMLSKAKLARVQRVAEAFLVMNRKKYSNFKARIEAVCIVLNFDKSVKELRHYDQF